MRRCSDRRQGSPRYTGCACPKARVKALSRQCSYTGCWPPNVRGLQDWGVLVPVNVNPPVVCVRRGRVERPLAESVRGPSCPTGHQRIDRRTFGAGGTAEDVGSARRKSRQRSTSMRRPSRWRARSLAGVARHPARRGTTSGRRCSDTTRPRQLVTDAAKLQPSHCHSSSKIELGQARRFGGDRKPGEPCLLRGTDTLIWVDYA